MNKRISYFLITGNTVVLYTIIEVGSDSYVFSALAR